MLGQSVCDPRLVHLLGALQYLLETPSVKPASTVSCSQGQFPQNTQRWALNRTVDEPWRTSKVFGITAS